MTPHDDPEWVFVPGCTRCQQDRHWCPGCGEPADHRDRPRQHGPGCPATPDERNPRG